MCRILQHLIIEGDVVMEVTIHPVQIQDASAIHRICIQDAVLPYMVFLPSIRVDAMEIELAI